MAKVRQPEWLTELVGLTQELCTAPGGRDQPLTGKDRNLGAAHRDSERPAGWFWVGLGGRQAPESDQLEASYLAPSQGGEQYKYQLIESVQDGNVLRVRVGEHAPMDGLFLWVPGRSPGFLEQSLVDCLSSIERFDLVNCFGTGKPEPVPPRNGDEQEQARKACQAPGLNLVWGPPGTGKTRVIAMALQDIIEARKSALLVSGTNIAVDNALQRAAEAIGPEPGVMVRAGNPHLAAIADNPAVCLDRLVRDLQEELEARRRDLEEQIEALRDQPTLVKLEKVHAVLDEFDVAAYRAALRRVTDADRLKQVESELVALHNRDEEVARVRRIAASEFQKWQRQAADAEPARRRLETAKQLWKSEIEDRQNALDRAKADVLLLQSQLQARTEELSHARKRKRFGHGHLKTLVQEAVRQVSEATARRDELARLTPGLIEHARVQIQDHLDAALPYTLESIGRLDENLGLARETLSTAEAVQRSHEAQVSALASQVLKAQQAPKPESGDRDLVARGHSSDLPRLLSELPELERQTTKTLREIRRLEDEHERIVGRMRKEGSAIRKEIVAGAHVIATTLAMLRLRPELREREYDYVIVDEVAFASPPEVVYAASLASSGVTLLGDFLQNNPITPDQFKGDKTTAAAKRWYQQDCFAIFGVRDPEEAEGSLGCVTLTRQRRFGRGINDLANAVAYRGLLQAVYPERANQEIVLIDVDGLGSELASVRRVSKTTDWWPVGALLSRALAESAIQEGSAQAGIVVPYKVQADLVQDYLNESQANPQVEVGTSHRFQGREFDTVVFDLVEDGSQRGWVAQGNLYGSSWEAGGVRLFNVGITRARHKLYLIANVAAIERARSGPLHAVRRLRDSGSIHVVRAADILGLPNAPEDDLVAADIWRALRNHATLIDLFDEDVLPEELCRRFDEATERIWLWSPWVGRRAEQLLPHLIDAQNRDVRVHPVVLPPDQVNHHLQSRHEEIATQVPKTVYFADEHQKLVVIDRSLTFIGSMNVLAHVPGGRHEIMALFQAARWPTGYSNTNAPPNSPTLRAASSAVTRSAYSGRALGRTGNGACTGYAPRD
jgi:superfamily I DNA/RNA helicase